MNIKTVTLLMFSAFIAGQANAVIIEGEFRGYITEIFDRSKYDDAYTKFWRNLKIGDPVHGTFWYDSELAPSPTGYDPNRITYRSYGPDIPVWNGLTIFADDRVFDITQDQPDPQWSRLYYRDRGIQMEDNAFFTASTNVDGFSIINSILWHDRNSTSLQFIVRQEQGDMFSSVELGQEFTWADEDPHPFFSGGVIRKSGYADIGLYEGEAHFAVTYATGRTRKNANLNEPGILLLMLTGILSILIRKNYLLKPKTQ